MVYSKEIVIKKKILKEDDILRIAKLIHEQFQPGDYKEEYDILFDDQSRITAINSIDVFKSDEFKRRRSERIWFEYRSKGFENRIEIYLYNSLLSFGDSKVEISSTDKDWYNSVCNEILTIINEVEKQKFSITLGMKYFASAVLGMIEGLLLSYSLNKILGGMFTDSQFALVISAFGMIFMWINVYFFELLEKAYPNIEFAFGPVYLNKSQKIRNSLGIFFPLLIDLVFFGLGFLG